MAVDFDNIANAFRIAVEMSIGNDTEPTKLPAKPLMKHASSAPDPKAEAQVESHPSKTKGSKLMERKQLVKHDLPREPAQPQTPRPYRPGPLLPGYVFNDPKPDPGWKISRVANGEWREMVPASQLEKWEDIVKRVDDGGQVNKTTKKWEDPKRPALPDLPSVVWGEPEDAGENHDVECLMFRPPPGSNDPLDPNDICQGCLGDCWFMAGASTVAMEKSLDHRWLGRYDEDRGLYEFVFYEENDFSERRVVVDRAIPLRKLAPLKPGYRRGDNLPGDYRYYLCKSGTPGELWPSLIEKAFAKLYGGYENIVGGLSSIAIANLVRGVPYTFKFGSSELPSDPEILWRKLATMWNDGYLMGIGWKEAPEGSAGGGPCGEPAGPFGLISGHAYGILGLYKSASTGKKFLKIRNPHAGNEWQGPWSDNSKEIKQNPKVLEETEMSKGDDGIFLMDIQDVITYGEGLEGVDCFDKLPEHRKVIPVD